MVSLISKWSKHGLFGFICVALGACSQGRPAAQATAETQASSIESALESPLAACEQEQATCLGSATDRASAAACGDAFRECLGGAAEIGRQMAESIEQCRDTAAQCAVNGGATGADACRTEYEGCVGAATAEQESQPPAAGADAPGPGLPRLPAAGSRAPRLPIGGDRSLPGRRLPFAGAGGFGGLPRLPSAGGISLPSGGRVGLPGRRGGASTACFEALRECVQAPMADLNQCATTARECLRGGESTGAAGAGGAP